MKPTHTLPPLAKKFGGFPGGDLTYFQFDSVPDDDETDDERRERQSKTSMVELPAPIKKMWMEQERSCPFQEGARLILKWVRQHIFGVFTRNEIYDMTGQDPLAEAYSQNEDAHANLVRRVEARLGRQPAPDGHEDRAAEIRARLAALEGPKP